MNQLKIQNNARSYSTQRYHPRARSQKAHSWKQAILGSCLAILGLGNQATAYAQEKTGILESSTDVRTTAGARLCNSGYIKDREQIYEVSARHCKTGATGSRAVNKDDIVYSKIPNLPTGAQVMKILDGNNTKEGALDKKEVIVKLCVYNIEGEIGKNRYCQPFTGTARFDSQKHMYYVEIPTKIKQWYSDNVSDFGKYKMKSASGSPVEWQGKLAGVVSGIGYNPFPETEIAGFKPFEGRFYFAPAKTRYS